MNCLKQTLRSQLKQKRADFVKSQTQSQLKQIEEDVSKNLQSYINIIKSEFPDQKIILAGFYPIQSEINCIEVIKNLQDQYTCALPVHFKNEELKPLYFREFKSDTQLIIGHYNIPIPSEDSPQVIPNIILTPFLGFDKLTLQRIGFGGGHFDRTIKYFKENQIKLKFVGIGFQCQYIQDLPAEEQDEPLDCIITEKGIYLK
ncbi:5-formyltetrahydrofolate cyclo-ligase (macronuclear) [Tetrahymena thermophila SB210]|uniref:5-formyltetrahydrofolate cyclo-ligase n=1 Tax=Tetrahymena thermophila (strain SB210) TaxID=312017 RepID=I7M2V7_TETTS|nr:5-formyltetrahydrofolate cyclo-ligase [Tetrahymena thermophila SB210]EAS01388.2 5-formyltetrahydrofolate cyclo-ligase [Tetrahymena thermophila SB210]|eukprot:XP_001021634.2 5-formyltetrahydrofolate cyclo-ligase [Tetrahymena thermophila SB210]